MYEAESVLIKALGDSPKMKIIDFFMENLLNDFTKREVIKGTGMSTKTFYKYFPDIEEIDIVKPTRKIGKAQLYTLNKENEIVKNLMKIEEELSEKARKKQVEEKERKKIKATA